MDNVNAEILKLSMKTGKIDPNDITKAEKNLLLKAQQGNPSSSPKNYMISKSSPKVRAGTEFPKHGSQSIKKPLNAYSVKDLTKVNDVDINTQYLNNIVENGQRNKQNLLGKFANQIKSYEYSKNNTRDSVLISDLDNHVDRDAKANNGRAHQRIAKKREAKLLASEDALKMVDG
jgi:hypothetical protein